LISRRDLRLVHSWLMVVLLNVLVHVKMNVLVT
jgi:hypothetical protein